MLVFILIHDGYDFSGDQWLGGWEVNTEYPRVKATGTQMWNKDFKSFRERTGYGCDFRIMTKPELANIGEYRYNAFPYMLGGAK